METTAFKPVFGYVCAAPTLIYKETTIQDFGELDTADTKGNEETMARCECTSDGSQPVEFGKIAEYCRIR